MMKPSTEAYGVVIDYTLYQLRSAGCHDANKLRNIGQKDGLQVEEFLGITCPKEIIV